MTEAPRGDQFETRFAARVRAYTDPAAARSFDASAVSRSAMAVRRGTGRYLGRPGWSADRLRWAAVATIVIVGVVTLAFATSLPRADVAQPPTPPRPSAARGPLPVAIQHAWQRPIAETPDAKQWVSGSLDFATDRLQYSVLDGPVSSATIEVTGVDSFAVSRTVEMPSCVAADSGTYHWLLEGKDTVLTLTPIGADSCAARQDALAGQWVRADFPPPRGFAMAPGAHETTAFDQFGARSRSGALSYVVPEGWSWMDDSVGTFVIAHFVDGASEGKNPPIVAIAVLAQPRMADDKAGQACGPLGPEPGGATSVDDLVTHITGRPGVVSTEPVEVSIGGYAGQLLDLHIAADWKGGCMAPEGVITSVPILVTASSTPAGGALTAIGPDHPVRVVLLDLGNRRSLAIVIFELDPPRARLDVEPPATGYSRSQWEEHVAEAMPIIESFEFRPATP
jgi:hypothetical protein